MRDVPIAGFVPEPNTVYIAALVSAASGSGCGIVLTSQSTGRFPCRGLDSDSTDGFEGDVLLDTTMRPSSGVLVQYIDSHGQPAGQTTTDGRGRHSIYLPAGDYSYHYALPVGGSAFAPSSSQAKSVSVSPGHTLAWEEAEVSDAAPRQIAFVTERLICDWHSEDGAPFRWNDVENVMCQLQERIERYGAELRRVVASGSAGATFARPDLLNSLLVRGVWVQDMAWKELQWASAWRNFETLARAKMGIITRHDRADFQFEQVAFVAGEKRTEAPKGLPRYLADARVMSFTSSAQMAALEGEGQFHAHALGEEFAGEYFGDEPFPQTASESFDSIRRLFGVTTD